MAFRSALCMLALAPAAADEFLHPRRASDCSEAAFCCWWPQNQDPARCGQCGAEWGNRKYLPGTSCPSSDGRPFETGEQSECQGVGTWCESGAAPPRATTTTPAPAPGTPCSPEDSFCPVARCSPAPPGFEYKVPGDLVFISSGQCCPTPCQLVRSPLTPADGAPCSPEDSFCPVAACSPAPPGCSYKVPGDLAFTSGQCCPTPCQLACSLSCPQACSPLTPAPSPADGTPCSSEDSFCPVARCSPARAGCWYKVPGDLVFSSGQCCPAACQLECFGDR
jgi:hypothetical protein